MKTITKTILFLLFFANIAQAQVVKLTVMLKGATVEKAVICVKPSILNKKNQEQWVYYTDSLGKRLILAEKNDTIEVIKYPFFYKTFILNHQKLADTVFLDDAANILTCNFPINNAQKIKLTKADFESKNMPELILFLGEKLKDIENAKLTSEQQWLKYLYFLKTDNEESGILQHTQNRLVQNKDYFKNNLLPLLMGNNQIENSGFRETMTYFYYMFEKYRPTILKYNAEHNNFWTSDFTQKLAELGSTEQEIQAALPRFEADLALYIRQNPRLFCEFE